MAIFNQFPFSGRKISENPVNIALAGDELLAIVQGGVTKKVTVSDLLALLTGLVIPDSAPNIKGAVKISVAPVNPVNPIAIGTNDPRVSANGVIAGIYGNSAQTVTITVDVYGKVTAITANSISVGIANISGLSVYVNEQIANAAISMATQSALNLKADRINGLASTGGITLSGSTVTVVANIVWFINGTTYTKATNSAFIIPSATDGFYRKDLIYATTSGTVLILQGLENASVAVEPSLPVNSIRVTVVDVFGASLTQPQPDLSDYATKAYVATNFIKNQDGTPQTAHTTITGNYTSRKTNISYPFAVVTNGADGSGVASFVAYVNSSNSARYRGDLIVFNKNGYSQYIYPSPSLPSNSTITFPNTSGTVALTSDITAAAETTSTILTKIGDGSKIASTYLPSYVDDILEFANLAALPVTGETGKIYITLDSNKEYRWSGIVYVELVASPGSTDAVPEGTTNKYWTNARTIASVLTGYVKAATVTAITATTEILIAIGILEKALDAKQATLVSGTNIKTFEGETLLGTTDIKTVFTHAQFLVLSTAQKQGIKTVRDTLANLTVANYTYPASWKIIEIQVDTTELVKIADGVTAYNSLTYGVATDLLSLVDPQHFVENSSNKLSIIDSYLSSMFISKRYSAWTVLHGSAAINLVNSPVITITGTYVAKTLTSGTYYNRLSKVGILSSSATAQSIAVIRSARLEYSLEVGFELAFSFVPADGLLTTKNLYGVTSDTNALSIINEPSVNTVSCISVANDTGDTNFQVLSGTSGSLVKADLGASFPKTLTDIIHIRIKAPKAATTVQVIVTKISKTDGSVLAQEIRDVTTLPAQSTGLCRQLWRCSGVDAVAPTFEFIELETQIVPIL